MTAPGTRSRSLGAELERSWVAFRGSSTVRGLAGTRGVRRLRDSTVGRRLDTGRRYVETAVRHRRDPRRFASVTTCCLFLGTVKSGGSLLGAMLDAHPRIVLADEVGPLRFVDAGFRREQLFHLLEKGSRREALKGRVTARRLEPYSLAVPGQHQGRAREVTVVGDSTAGPTTRLLDRRPELLVQLRAILGTVEDRYIHVVRDPIDPISATVVRGGRNLDDAIDDYVAQTERVQRLRTEIGSDRLLTVHYEDLVAAPRQVLAAAVRFLGEEPEPDHLVACAGLIDRHRPPERRWVPWTPSDHARVDDLLATVTFLRRYRAHGAEREAVRP